MATLSAITAQEIELVSQFVALLEKERDALKKGEIGQLGVIGAAKMPLIEQLNAFEVSRGQTLGVVGSENIRSAMKQWLASHPNEKTTANNWAKLLDLARQAKQLHELNSLLVNMHLQQTNELLAVLTRQPNAAPLYGSNGQAAQVTGSRIVDSA